MNNMNHCRLLVKPESIILFWENIQWCKHQLFTGDIKYADIHVLEFLSLLCALWFAASQFSSFPLLNKLIQFKLRVVTHTSLGFRPQKVGNLTHSMSLNSLWRLKVMSAVSVACPVLSLFCACPSLLQELQTWAGLFKIGFKVTQGLCEM